jgi:hypothetical protein
LPFRSGQALTTGYATLVLVTSIAKQSRANGNVSCGHSPTTNVGNPTALYANGRIPFMNEKKGISKNLIVYATLLFNFLSCNIFNSISDLQQVDSEIESRYIVANGGLTLRDKPYKTGNKIALIPDETLIFWKKIDERNNKLEENYGLPGKWIKIEYKNQSGYIFSGYTTSVKPPTVGYENIQSYLDENFDLKDTKKILTRTGNHYSENSPNYQTLKFYDKDLIYFDYYDGVEGAGECLKSQSLTLQELFLIGKRFDKFNEKDLVFPINLNFNLQNKEVIIKNVSYTYKEINNYLNEVKQAPYQTIVISYDQSEVPIYELWLITSPFYAVCITWFF